MVDALWTHDTKALSEAWGGWGFDVQEGGRGSCVQEAHHRGRGEGQGCIRREGASKAVRQAVGGGCQSGYCRLQMPSRLALGVRGTVAGRRLGTLVPGAPVLLVSAFLGALVNRDASEGKGPQRRPQRRLDRRLEGVAKAVGGGYCRLQMPLRLALGVRGTVARHRPGA